MIDSGASVNVCPTWFGNSKLEQSDGAISSQRCQRKTAPGIRKATDLVENVRSEEYGKPQRGQDHAGELA